jgi:branched-chain amino acid transport system permease protein
MKRNLIFLLSVVVIAGALLVIGVPLYIMHILVQILLWGAVYSGWTLLARFGIVSLGHSGFVGIGAYGVVLLWNLFGLTPWIGILVSTAAAMLVAFAVGYPCFRLRVVGHNFALVTLALGVVVQLSIIAVRDVTGGSLGLTPKTEAAAPLLALQFSNKNIAFLFALCFWLASLWVWTRVDKSMTRLSLAASAEQEDAAAAIGIHVAFEKLKVLLMSAAITAVGGSLLGQYLMYINPETFSGPPVALQMLYASVVGGMYTALGPTIGSGLTLALKESLRVLFGTRFIGGANTIYGLLLILFVIFMPQGIWGAIVSRFSRKRSSAP